MSGGQHVTCIAREGATNFVDGIGLEECHMHMVEVLDGILCFVALCTYDADGCT